MIHLTSNLLFSEGAQRFCYIHPDDDALCIKILREPEPGSPGSRETRREIAYYGKLQCRGISWDMLPYFHGQVDTNLGKGSVFELIRDHDGTISRPLYAYLEDPGITRRYVSILAPALGALASYLRRERIITGNIKMRNIALQIQGPGRGRVYLLDDIGDTDFIPLATYWEFWAQRKISRKWAKFEASLTESYPDNPWIPEVLSGIRGVGDGCEGNKR